VKDLTCSGIESLVWLVLFTHFGKVILENVRAQETLAGAITIFMGCTSVFICKFASSRYPEAMPPSKIKKNAIIHTRISDIAVLCCREKLGSENYRRHPTAAVRFGRDYKSGSNVLRMPNNFQAHTDHLCSLFDLTHITQTPVAMPGQKSPSSSCAAVVRRAHDDSGKA